MFHLNNDGIIDKPEAKNLRAPHPQLLEGLSGSTWLR